ncbi:MAG: hypothetical protein K2Q21_04240 [Chitinophagaceae bacterium]|nr:hypothetical protein [Chitinophagaceae bacterium]
MISNEPIQIALSKRKITWLFSGSLVFIALGLWFVVSPPKIENGLFGNPLFIFATGVASIVLFSIFGFVTAKKLLDKRPGLIIDKNGILDQSSGVSAGLIPWSDIQEIKTTQVYNQTFIMIFVQNPNDYIAREPGIFKRKMMEINFNTYGSPISITANTLQCDFNELLNLLQTHLQINKPC